MSINPKLKVSNDNLKVSEIFATIQGEGVTTGLPSVFIRLALCNLHCKWCDAFYTWNWIGTPFIHDDGDTTKVDPDKEIKEMTSEDIIEEVQKLSGENIRNVVITGGEPLMQQRSPEFISLLVDLKTLYYTIEIETNGTIIPTDDVDAFVTQYNVSPKLNNSGNPINQRFVIRAECYFAKSPKAWFKYVVTNDHEDLAEIEADIRMCNIPPNKILIMPEGRSQKEIGKRAKELVELCKQRGWRYCNRLQVQIWDKDLRGV